MVHKSRWEGRLQLLFSSLWVTLWAMSRDITWRKAGEWEQVTKNETSRRQEQGDVLMLHLQ